MGAGSQNSLRHSDFLAVPSSANKKNPRSDCRTQSVCQLPRFRESGRAGVIPVRPQGRARVASGLFRSIADPKPAPETRTALTVVTNTGPATTNGPGNGLVGRKPAAQAPKALVVRPHLGPSSGPAMSTFLRGGGVAGGWGKRGKERHEGSGRGGGGGGNGGGGKGGGGDEERGGGAKKKRGGGGGGGTGDRVEGTGGNRGGGEEVGSGGSLKGGGGRSPGGLNLDKGGKNARVRRQETKNKPKKKGGGEEKKKKRNIHMRSIRAGLPPNDARGVQKLVGGSLRRFQWRFSA